MPLSVEQQVGLFRDALNNNQLIVRQEDNPPKWHVYVTDDTGEEIEIPYNSTGFLRCIYSYIHSPESNYNNIQHIYSNLNRQSLYFQYDVINAHSYRGDSAQANEQAQVILQGIARYQKHQQVVTALREDFKANNLKFEGSGDNLKLFVELGDEKVKVEVSPLALHQVLELHHDEIYGSAIYHNVFDNHRTISDNYYYKTPHNAPSQEYKTFLSTLKETYLTYQEHHAIYEALKDDKFEIRGDDPNYPFVILTENGEKIVDSAVLANWKLNYYNLLTGDEQNALINKPSFNNKGQQLPKPPGEPVANPVPTPWADILAAANPLDGDNLQHLQTIQQGQKIHDLWPTLADRLAKGEYRIGGVDPNQTLFVDEVEFDETALTAFINYINDDNVRRTSFNNKLAYLKNGQQTNNLHNCITSAATFQNKLTRLSNHEKGYHTRQKNLALHKALLDNQPLNFDRDKDGNLVLVLLTEEGKQVQVNKADIMTWMAAYKDFVSTGNSNIGFIERPRDSEINIELRNKLQRKAKWNGEGNFTENQAKTLLTALHLECAHTANRIVNPQAIGGLHIEENAPSKAKVMGYYGFLSDIIQGKNAKVEAKKWIASLYQQGNFTFGKDSAGRPTLLFNLQGDDNKPYKVHMSLKAFKAFAQEQGIVLLKDGISPVDLNAQLLRDKLVNTFYKNNTVQTEALCALVGAFGEQYHLSQDTSEFVKLVEEMENTYLPLNDFTSADLTKLKDYLSVYKPHHPLTTKIGRLSESNFRRISFSQAELNQLNEILTHVVDENAEDAVIVTLKTELHNKLCQDNLFLRMKNKAKPEDREKVDFAVKGLQVLRQYKVMGTAPDNVELAIPGERTQRLVDINTSIFKFDAEGEGFGEYLRDREALRHDALTDVDLLQAIVDTRAKKREGTYYSQIKTPPLDGFPVLSDLEVRAKRSANVLSPPHTPLLNQIKKGWLIDLLNQGALEVKYFTKRNAPQERPQPLYLVPIHGKPHFLYVTRDELSDWYNSLDRSLQERLDSRVKKALELTTQSDKEKWHKLKEIYCSNGSKFSKKNASAQESKAYFVSLFGTKFDSTRYKQFLDDIREGQITYPAEAKPYVASFVDILAEQNARSRTSKNDSSEAQIKLNRFIDGAIQRNPSSLMINLERARSSLPGLGYSGLQTQDVPARDGMPATVKLASEKQVLKPGSHCPYDSTLTVSSSKLQIDTSNKKKLGENTLNATTQLLERKGGEKPKVLVISETRDNRQVLKDLVKSALDAGNLPILKINKPQSKEMHFYLLGTMLNELGEDYKNRLRDNLAALGCSAQAEKYLSLVNLSSERYAPTEAETEEVDAGSALSP